jgi:hypothetical protein
MKRVFLYACALVVLGLFLAALSASCTPNGPGSPYISTEPPKKAQMTPPTIEKAMATWFPPTAIPTLMPSFTPEAAQVRWNFLLLGGDMGPGRPKPVSGGAGDKTDVMLLVTVLMNTPAEITIVQFPRNLWSPLYPDHLLFEVYGQDGEAGMHEYFEKVFGITLHGVAYVDMRHFVEYVDLLGGVEIPFGGAPGGPGDAVCEGGKWSTSGRNTCVYDGTTLLAWLRDNDNNWKHGVYDSGMRQHRALVAILDKVYQKFGDKDFEGVFALFSGVKTDLSVFQFVQAAGIGYRALHFGAITSYDRLAYPTIQRGDVPVPPGRAEVAGDVSLKDWMAAVLSPW